MIDLKALAASLSLRVTLDPCADDEPRSERAWLYRIAGRLGHVSVHGANTLAVSMAGNRTQRDRVVAAGATIVQDGDREFTATFPPDCLAAIAKIIHARKKRVLSPEQRERLAAVAVRFQKSRGTGSANGPRNDADGSGGVPVPADARRGQEGV